MSPKEFLQETKERAIELTNDKARNKRVRLWLLVWLLFCWGLVWSGLITINTNYSVDSMIMSNQPETTIIKPLLTVMLTFFSIMSVIAQLILYAIPIVLLLLVIIVFYYDYHNKLIRTKKTGILLAIMMQLLVQLVLLLIPMMIIPVLFVIVSLIITTIMITLSNTILLPIIIITVVLFVLFTLIVLIKAFIRLNYTGLIAYDSFMKKGDQVVPDSLIKDSWRFTKKRAVLLSRLLLYVSLLWVLIIITGGIALLVVGPWLLALYTASYELLKQTV